MKSLIMILSFCMAAWSLNGQSSLQVLENLIHQFNDGGAANDVQKLEPILHENFRIVFNNTAENKVQVLDRATYLSLIEAKKFGGEARKLNIQSLSIEDGLMASASTQQQGVKNTIYALKHFVFQDGNWLMTEEVVYMK